MYATISTVGSSLKPPVGGGGTQANRVSIAAR